MISRLLIVLVILAAIYFLIRWFINTPPAVVKQRGKQAGIALIIGIFAILAVTGKLHWLFALLAGLIPFAQRLLSLLRGYQMFKNIAGQFKTNPSSANNTTGQQSTLTTSFLKMTLDHDSGELIGVVLSGQFRGQLLQEMMLDNLLLLLSDCRIEDEESATLLENYLDRRFGNDWRDQFHQGASSNASTPSTEMSLEEAYAILGVAATDSTNDIKLAYKRLIQKLHPDRGGSSYLATKINQAKELILRHRGEE